MAARAALLPLLATVAAIICGVASAATPPSAAASTTPTPTKLLHAVPVARSLISSSPVPLSNLTSTRPDATTGWRCPDVSNISEISCTCDVPHTIRCRGQAVLPRDLAVLTQILRNHGGVSLLDLAVHGLGSPAGSSFKGLDLLGLVITKAGLQTLPPDVFSGLEGTLVALGLPNNKLISVPVDALVPLRQLQRLDISDNQLHELPSRAFPALLQLENLDLAGNSLRLLQPEAFVRLPHLTSLNLANNQLDAVQINDRTMRGLHGLQRLSLQSNLLKGAVTPTFISGVHGLLSLDLSDNSLTMLARGALSAYPNLRELDLSHNMIDVIEDHAFVNLTRLRHLKLSHNRVVAVSGYSLAHLPLLTHLAMADNALRAITADLLHQLPALKSLDLDANDISLLQPHVFNSTPALQHLSLADNPLHCDCKVWWLVVWLMHHPTLSKEEKASAVCATPSHLENAPLDELTQSQLVCIEESYHDYHDYYHDYYHDEALADDTPDIRRSDAEITLRVAHWVHQRADSVPNKDVDKDLYQGVELIWQVDERAIPYTCDAVRVLQLVQGTDGAEEVVAWNVSVNCSSDESQNPHRVTVTVPAEVLMPGSTYRYCLTLLERGTGKQEALLPGCSELLLLSEAPSSASHRRGQVTSLTAGGVGRALVVHTRVDEDGPCTYTLAVVAGDRLAATQQLNCTEARHEFQSLNAGQYVACARPDLPGINHDLGHLEHRLKAAQNVTAALQQDFAVCTPVINFEPYREADMSVGPLLTLLFTLPGLALVVTLYIIARRVWRDGGVPWRWDPRTQKSGKYFLYTGEIATPSLSLDPLPADTPETTTPV